MGHSLKIKCVDSRVNVHILASASVPFTLTTVQVPNLALTHTKRITVYLNLTLSYPPLSPILLSVSQHIFRLPLVRRKPPLIHWSSIKIHPLGQREELSSGQGPTCSILNQWQNLGSSWGVCTLTSKTLETIVRIWTREEYRFRKKNILRKRGI